MKYNIGTSISTDTYCCAYQCYSLALANVQNKCRYILQDRNGSEIWQQAVFYLQGLNVFAIIHLLL